MSIVEPTEITITYKRPLYLSLKKITSSKEMNIIMREYLKQRGKSLDYVEYLWIICLSRNNGVLGINQISQGGHNGTSLTIPQMLQIALLQHASNVILVHNHPSGNLKASEQDIAMNKKMRTAFKAISMEQLDHIILTTEDYYSFNDEGLI